MRTCGRVLGVLGAVMASACAGEASGRDGEMLPPVEASARVSEMLYGQNLISDPQVNAKMNEYVLAVSRDGLPADSVMPEFHHWLVEWVRVHPNLVQAARLEPGLSAQ